MLISVLVSPDRASAVIGRSYTSVVRTPCQRQDPSAVYCRAISAMRKQYWLTLLFAAHTVSAATAGDQPRIIEKHRNEITHIPGLETHLKSKHYGGYINIDEAHGRNLYYYFVTSQGNPVEDPLVLWLNGGPGCSSFDGASGIPHQSYNPSGCSNH